MPAKSAVRAFGSISTPVKGGDERRRLCAAYYRFVIGRRHWQESGDAGRRVGVESRFEDGVNENGDAPRDVAIIKNLGNGA